MKHRNWANSIIKSNELQLPIFFDCAKMFLPRGSLCFLFTSIFEWRNCDGEVRRPGSISLSQPVSFNFGSLLKKGLVIQGTRSCSCQIEWSSHLGRLSWITLSFWRTRKKSAHEAAKRRIEVEVTSSTESRYRRNKIIIGKTGSLWSFAKCMKIISDKQVSVFIYLSSWTEIRPLGSLHAVSIHLRYYKCDWTHNTGNKLMASMAKKNIHQFMNPSMPQFATTEMSFLIILMTEHPVLHLLTFPPRYNNFPNCTCRIRLVVYLSISAMSLYLGQWCFLEHIGLWLCCDIQTSLRISRRKCQSLHDKYWYLDCTLLECLRAVSKPINAIKCLLVGR